jgi:hypothetical protein
VVAFRIVIRFCDASVHFFGGFGSRKFQPAAGCKTTLCLGMKHNCGLYTYAEPVDGRDQRAVRGCNVACEEDSAETCCSDAVVNESCGVWADEVVGLLPGLRVG